MNISYDYYRIFYYVAKYKSFSGAARVLFNNQPNLTRMMNRLEEELGCTLFIRQRHGVSLTPEGEKLYAHVAVAFEHILCGEEEIAREKSLESGMVSVAASEIAMHGTLLPALKCFRSTYPGVRIRVSNHSTPQALEVLKNGLADFAVVTEPFVLPSGLSAFILKEIQEIPVCSRTLGLSAGTLYNEELQKRYPLIGYGEKTGSFAFYCEKFHQLGLTYTPDIAASTAYQILPMVKSDLGIGFVPEEFLETESREALTVLTMQPPLPSRNICLVKRKGISLSIAAARLEKQLISN